MWGYFEAAGNTTWGKRELWLLVHTAVVSPEAWRIVAALISWRIPLGFASTGETGLGERFLDGFLDQPNLVLAGS